MEKLLIRGGRVIDPANGVDKMADVLIADGKIAAVGENLTDAEAKVYDAAGKVVAPGFIDTDMTKDLPEEHKTALIGQTALGRLGQTDDVANACLYLASPAGAYVTGIVLHVNGGMYMG